MPQTAKQLAACTCDGQLSIEEAIEAAMTETAPTVEFRKKPIIIKAIQFTGENFDEIEKFCAVTNEEEPPHFRATRPDEHFRYMKAIVWDKLHSSWVGVKEGQWIVRGLKGENYPIDEDILASTYERLDQPRGAGVHE
jgi:hypothetical protein